MPKKMPKLNTKNIAKRDKRICQYSGEYAPDGTVDHIVPISKNGARKSWENMVWCKKEINARKGNQLNENIGLKLIRTPKAPRPGVAMQSIEPLRPEWQPFLIHSNTNMQSVA
jgi:5-methylcytosine-specific restriction endonuclease McrA